jgi:hypothetical protein
MVITQRITGAVGESPRVAASVSLRFNALSPKAIVLAAKAGAIAGYRLMVPLHHIHAALVRSHFNAMEVGVQDGPRPDETSTPW